MKRSIILLIVAMLSVNAVADSESQKALRFDHNLNVISECYSVSKYLIQGESALRDPFSDEMMVIKKVRDVMFAQTESSPEFADKVLRSAAELNKYESKSFNSKYYYIEGCARQASKIQSHYRIYGGGFELR